MPATVMFTLTGGLLILAALAHAAPAADVEARFVPVPHSGINDKRFVPLPHSGIDNSKKAVSVPISRRKTTHLARRDDHSETIHNWHNNVFTVDIDIGTPKQYFQVQLDTGSNGLWVWSDTCSTECPSWPGFVRSKSTSYATTGANFTTNYVVTTIQGEVGTDTISIGGYDVKQEFGVALTAKGTGFKDSSVTGILGFGFPAGGKSGPYPASNSWWANAVSQWPEPVFGIGLTRTPDRSPLTDGGKLTLGGVDTDAFTGQLNYLPVVGTAGWKVTMDSLKVNGNAVGGTGLNASIDSGTTGLMGPLATVAQVYQTIPGAFLDQSASTAGKLEYYRYPCEHGPQVALAFGGVDYQVHTDDLWIFKNKHNTSSTEETCLGNLFGWSHDDWVVGNAFMNAAYTAFRREPRGIAFAPYK